MEQEAAGPEGRRVELVLQRLRVHATGEIEYRFGSRYRDAEGRAQWVPASPRIPPRELEALVRGAIERGWIRSALAGSLARVPGASARKLEAWLRSLRTLLAERLARVRPPA